MIKKKAQFTAYLHQYNVEFIDIKPLLSKGNFIAGKLLIAQKGQCKKEKLKWIRFINYHHNFHKTTVLILACTMTSDM